VLLAHTGDPLRLHVVAAVSEQVQGFELDGHRWPLEPGVPGSSVVAAEAIGGQEVLTVVPVGGAGGEGHQAGDYAYGDTRAPYRDGGMWGVLRVSGSGDVAQLSSRPTAWPRMLGVSGAGLLLGLGVWGFSRRRRRRSVQGATAG
jgi:hypothetical protein